MWGSSAGARMAAGIGSHGVAGFGGDSLPKPTAVVMAYTAHSDYWADEGRPLWSSVTKMPLRLRRAWKGDLGPSQDRYAGRVSQVRKSRPWLWVCTGTSAQGWVADAIRFWEKLMKRGS